MSPQEKLIKISEEFDPLVGFGMGSCKPSSFLWLIARVKQLEEAFNKIDNAYYGTSVEVARIAKHALDTDPLESRESK